MTSSFGRRNEQPAEQPLPVMVMPPVQIPAVLAITPESMRAMQAQIRDLVAEAVRDGFAHAVGEYDPEAAEVFTASNPASGAAEPAAGQLADLTR